MPIMVPLASGWDGGTSWCEANLKSNLERWGVELYLTIGSSEMVQFDFRRVTRATRYNLWFFNVSWSFLDVEMCTAEADQQLQAAWHILQM
jgi:hypothetical protein